MKKVFYQVNGMFLWLFVSMLLAENGVFVPDGIFYAVCIAVVCAIGGLFDVIEGRK